jgi:F-type H+-transporting ATPase subunit b
MHCGGRVALAGYLVVALLWAGSTVAAEQLEDKAAGGGAHAAGQPDPKDAHKSSDTGVFAGETHQILDLAIWTVVVFLVLLFVLARFAWKPMLAGLKQREENIRGALTEAAKAREEAQSIRASLKKQLDEAHDRVRAILDEGRRDAQALRESELAKTKADIQAERERLHREIEVETDQALQRIWTHTAELATLVSARVIGKQLDANSHRQLVDEALADLRTAARGANGHA